MVGQIICSKRGRDKGCFMVIVKEDERFVYVCDGKQRPIDRPKKKNIIHISYTNTVLEKDGLKSNKQLKKAIAIYRDSVERRGN